MVVDMVGQEVEGLRRIQPPGERMTEDTAVAPPSPLGLKRAPERGLGGLPSLGQHGNGDHPRREDSGRWRPDAYPRPQHEAHDRRSPPAGVVWLADQRRRTGEDRGRPLMHQDKVLDRLDRTPTFR